MRRGRGCASGPALYVHTSVNSKALSTSGIFGWLVEVDPLPKDFMGLCLAPSMTTFLPLPFVEVMAVFCSPRVEGMDLAPFPLLPVDFHSSSGWSCSPSSALKYEGFQRLQHHYGAVEPPKRCRTR